MRCYHYLLLSVVLWAAAPIFAAEKEHYQVQIEVVNAADESVGNQDIVALLKQHISLETKKNAPNLDLDQIDMLARSAKGEVEQMLNTLGYFGNQISLTFQEEVFKIKIVLGQRVKVRRVQLALIGPLGADQELSRYYRQVMRDWRLPVGKYFTQDLWRQSKEKAVLAVTRYKYPLATIVSSQAKIDPQKAEANLQLTITSGKPVYFGQIQAEGDQRYPASLIINMAEFRPGQFYNRDLLFNYQAALERDGHYSTVLVKPLIHELNSDYQVPVHVQVSEVPRQKVELGLLYDSNDRFGIRLAYDHYNLAKKGYTGSLVGDLNRYEKNLAFGISTPRNERGYFYTTGLRGGQQTLQKLYTRNVSAAFWRVYQSEHNIRRFGVEYYLDESSVTEGNLKLGRRYVMLLNAGWRYHQIDNNDRPNNGYYFSGNFGTTLGGLLSGTSMQRALLEAGYYFTPENRNWGTWIVRGSAGMVHATDLEEVPVTLLFRSGGAASVRGYNLESIGIDGPNNSVLGGRVMAVASLEYQYPFANDYALALFHDAGDVSQYWHDMHFRQSSGVGLRWFSPIGPVAFDVAYAWQPQRFGWHINLGTRF